MSIFSIKTLSLCGGLIFLAGCGGDEPQASVETDEPVTAQTAVLHPQTTCPIMAGQPIDDALYVDYDGKRIHVCCAGCIAIVEANPQAALDTLAKAGQAPRQALCPVMNLPIDPELYVDHAGERIFLCCAGCIDTVKADPQAALDTLRAQGVAPAKSQ